MFELNSIKIKTNECVWHLQTHGHVVDRTAVAAGDEFSFEVVEPEAVYLGCLGANEELLTLSSEGDGGHGLVQPHLSVQRGKEDKFAVLFCRRLHMAPSQTSLSTWGGRTTHFKLLKFAAELTAKVPHPEPTSRFPLCSVLRLLTPCTEQNGSNLARSTSETCRLVFYRVPH